MQSVILKGDPNISDISSNSSSLSSSSSQYSRLLLILWYPQHHSINSLISPTSQYSELLTLGQASQKKKKRKKKKKVGVYSSVFPIYDLCLFLSIPNYMTCVYSSVFPIYDLICLVRPQWLNFVKSNVIYLQLRQPAKVCMKWNWISNYK